jgi:AcrR family transcriptional regulator
MNTPTRRQSRDEILDAVELIMSEDGAARVTIDAVAARSGFSKGGVLYNFPTKEALIEALVQRVTADFAKDVEAARPEFANSSSPTLSALVAASRCWLQDHSCIARALLAANQDNPELLSCFKDLKLATKTRILQEMDNVPQALVIWSAVEGLLFSNALELCIHDENEIDTVLAELQRQLHKNVTPDTGP